MARGKAAAQAANRRLGEALEQIATLEQRLAGQGDAHRAEVTELRAELQRAQGLTGRQIKKLADDQISAERDRANAAVRQARDAHLGHVVAGMALLESLPSVELAATHEQWVELAEAFGVDLGPLLAGMTTKRDGKPQSRHLARTTNARARWKHRAIYAIERGDTKSLGYNHDRWPE